MQRVLLQKWTPLCSFPCSYHKCKDDHLSTDPVVLKLFKVFCSYVTDNVAWTEQQKGYIFLDSSWESPNPSPLSPLLPCTSQKLFSFQFFSYTASTQCRRRGARKGVGRDITPSSLACGHVQLDVLNPTDDQEELVLPSRKTKPFCYWGPVREIPSSYLSFPSIGL